MRLLNNREDKTKLEAIDQFKKRLAIPDYKRQIPEYYEAMELAVNALEKQIAKQIVTKVQKEDLKVGHVIFKAGTKTYYCPDCNKAITLSDTCCRCCGQKLKLD